MAEVAERCREEISSLVLDTAESVSYRQLCTLVDVPLDEGREALEVFAKENIQNVGSIYVTIEKGATKNNDSPVDPRARVIRLTTNVTPSSQIYGVFPKNEERKATDEVLDAITINFWAKELKTRNEMMARTKKAPSSATECFYQSGIKCVEATLRENSQSSAGEVAMTAFDSIKRPASSGFGKSSFFSSKCNSSNKPASKSSSSSASSSSFSSMKSKVPAPAPTAVKKSTIDEEAMKKVLTVDSDDDDDMSDGDAPVFVTKRKSIVKSSKNRIISDNEDEPEGEVTATTPVQSEKVKAKSSTSTAKTGTKRKLATSPSSQMDDEPIAEPSPLKKRAFDASNVPTKKRILVTKTELNEKGYMTTKTSYEEVDMTPEEIAKARAEMEKKFNQQQAKYISSSKNTGKAPKTSKGPAKQKSIASFFMKK